MEPAPVDGGDQRLHQRERTFAQVMNNMSRRYHLYMEAQEALNGGVRFHREDEAMAPIPTPNLVTIPMADGRERVCIESALRIAVLRWTNGVCSFHDRDALYRAELREGRIGVREYVERQHGNHMPVLTDFDLILDDLDYARTHDWPEYRPFDITRT